MSFVLAVVTSDLKVLMTDIKSTPWLEPSILFAEISET